jgi:hypothetical protein
MVRSEAHFFAKPEAAIHALETFHLRLWGLMGDTYGLEPAAAVVFLTICLATGRTEPLRPAQDSGRTISRLAIAQSTGLPRETVRRRCAELARAGLICDCGRRGVAVASGKLLSDQEPAVLRRLIADTHQMIEALVRLGVFAAPLDRSRLSA